MADEIKAMPDVVWPTVAARTVARRAGAMADLIVRQRTERAGLTTTARQDCAGRARQVFDADHEGPTGSVADNLVENLYALEKVFRDLEEWVVEENAARRKAREREHDDSTWGGAKKYWNIMADAFTGKD